jgi:hypothetical protein
MVPLQAKEKLPFQITPFMLHLTREENTGALEDGKTVTRTVKP